MLRPSHRPLTFLGLALVGVLTLTSVARSLGAQSLTPSVVPPGGLIEPTTSTVVRPMLTAAQIQAFLPSRGPFLFPAPYGTQGVRLTNASDCAGGGDCVYSVGYSYWRNTNNHAGSNTMLIFLGMLRSKGGAGPSLFSYDKVTGDTRNLGPLFDSTSPFSWATGEGWYFSATQPTTLYVSLPDGSALYAYDVLKRTLSLVFDAATRFGGDASIWQLHSSNNDLVHSFTVRSRSTGQMLGCSVYNESTRLFAYFPAVGTYDECAVDASGRYVVIKENNDNNVIEDLQTGTEVVFANEAGAVGHSDNGFGVMVGEDDWNPLPGATRLWNLGLAFPPQSLPAGQGLLVYHQQNWATGLGHVTFGSARSDIPIAQQQACVSHAHRNNAPRVNELLCFRLDGSLNALIVAPNMVDLNAAGGSDDYWKLPKANLDVTGEYLIWTANQGGNRQDAFLVRVPSQLLDAANDKTPPTVAIASPAGGSTVQGTVTVSATAADNVGVASVQFLLDGVALGSPLQASPYVATWPSGSSTNGAHTLTASARDAAGNTAVSTPVTVTVSNAPVAVSISGVTEWGITGTSATVGWTTSAPADSQIAYGLTSAYGSLSTLDTQLVTAHAQTLTGLAAGTTYHFQVRSRGAQAPLSVSSDLTFTTAAPPTAASSVQWTSLVNVTSSGTTLKKTGGCNGCPDAGAISEQRIAAGDGYVEFTASETASLRAIGLGTSNPGTSLTEIRYALRLQSGTAEVREGGTYRADTTFTTGDVLRVAVAGGKVQYSKGGTIFYTSALAPAYPLFVDTSFADSNSTITKAIIVGSSPAVVWVDLVNASVLNNGATLQKTSGCDGCQDAGAASQQRIASGTGYVEFAAAAVSPLLEIGLSNLNPGTSMNEIKFGLRLQAGHAEVRESGTYRADVPFTSGDVFRIAVAGKAITYSKNGTVFYKSKLKATYPLLVDTSFATPGGAILRAVIVDGQ